MLLAPRPASRARVAPNLQPSVAKQEEDDQGCEQEQEQEDRRAVGHRHAKNDWAAMYPHIERLYMQERRQLRDVMGHMERTHGFKATYVDSPIPQVLEVCTEGYL